MAYEPHSGKADRAAYYLMERLRDEPWFLSVGVGEKHGSQCLFLYVRKPKIPKLKMIQGRLARIPSLCFGPIASSC